MSTKTTFKRVALVAVAALGLGVLSVAPSNAYTQADTLTLSSTTAAVTTAETATASSAPTATIAFLANAATDSMTVTASLVSAPATATALPYLQLSESTSAIVKKSDDTALAVGSAASPNSKAYVNTTGGNTGTRVSAKFKVYLSTNGTAGATVAGTYVVKLTPEVVTGAGAVNATAQTITFTVTAPDTAAASAYAHLLMTNGTTNPTTNAVVGQADSVTSGSKVAGTRIGSIGVALLNAAGTSVSESFTATITGAGTLGSGTGSGTGTVVGRSITVKSGNDVHIFADGTGGVGTITITSAAGKLLATKSVNFYGDASVIVLSSSSNAYVGTLTAPVTATAYDANGYLVQGAAIYVTSADTTVITASYAGPYTTSAAGTVSIPLTGLKLGTAKITAGLATSATDVTTTGYAVKSDALTVTVGGSDAEQAGVVVTTDKQVYTPGAYAYVTVKAVDAAGKTLSPKASGTYTVFATGGISASLPIETVTGIISSVGFTPAAKAGTATAADPIVAQAGEYVYKIKLPAYVGDLTLSWTTAAASYFPAKTSAGGVAGSVTVTLSDPGSQAAVDAAAEATDAANAATDAALAAADAADAATAAAEDASAAVAKLAKSVTTALNNLKKQITSLTALVNKLLKK